MKYTLIVLAYNVETTIIKCLKSIYQQTFNQYEVLIVNDGSTDHTEMIVKEYIENKNQFTLINQSNQGISGARNTGITKVNTPYFLFVDGDDYINQDTLKIIDQEIDDTNLLSFNLAYVDQQGRMLKSHDKPSFNELSGQDALVKMIHARALIEPTVGYVYQTNYFKNQHFEYPLGRLHEDFAVTIMVILKANKVKAISNQLYFYVQTDHSITRGASPLRRYQRALDVLAHFDQMINSISQIQDLDFNNKKIIESFLSNTVLETVSQLEQEYQNEMIILLKSRHLDQYLLGDTMSRKVKKLIAKISLKNYLKIIRRYGK